MKKLLEMLSVARPGNTESVEKWTEHYIDTIAEYGIFWKDAKGNRYLKIGENPLLAFTAHTDTVHSEEGELVVRYDSGAATIHAENSILGADDGVGCYLLLEMIQKKIPGLYIFYVEEESGGIGSRFSLDNHPEIYKNIRAMISLDRKGTGSVITHQGGRRSCSDAFALRLSEKLNEFGHSYSPDSTGIFTDSAVFIGTIPECTNLSVGYFRAHSRGEYVDCNFLDKFRDTLCYLNWGSIV